MSILEIFSNIYSPVIKKNYPITSILTGVPFLRAKMLHNALFCDLHIFYISGIQSLKKWPYPLAVKRSPVRFRYSPPSPSKASATEGFFITLYHNNPNTTIKLYPGYGGCNPLTKSISDNNIKNLPYLSTIILTPKTQNIIWHVYILQCNDGSYYTGCTSNLDERIRRHKMKSVHYTKDKLPVVLITHISFSNKYKAYNFEKYLKLGSGIAFRNKRLV